MVIDPRVARAALRHDPPAPAPPPSAEDPQLAVLTPAEREVAVLVAQGLTNREIAARMVLAKGTVKNDVSALLRKIGSGNHTALALALDRLLRAQP
ncbi:LuxR C-terminal-related transcriptional regulator [Actinomyces sp. 2119]|uniref:LuxR C-terminal-related transcriptional regulator n=1 Tax=Actinomyces sp. 2119 TaxID=2321393 RepID=UPI002175D58D|nr:LuxR C-terminal-related transcriptional regulator [Actinomyces sp. 2119]